MSIQEGTLSPFAGEEDLLLEDPMEADPSEADLPLDDAKEGDPSRVA